MQLPHPVFSESNALEEVKYPKIVKNAKVDDAIKNDAQIIIARAAFQTGDENKAKDAYAIVSEKATGKLAAEALYYDAYFKNKEGSWETSNKVIQKLAKELKYQPNPLAVALKTQKSNTIGVRRE